MTKFANKDGFSLAETLIAMGILAVGMIFIAGVFPVAIQLTTVSAERTIAAVVAEEAFAKVQLYGRQDTNDIDQLSGNLEDFNNPARFRAVQDIGEYEFTWPSTGSFIDPNSQYCWSALCRETAGDNSPVQVTIFVCRKAGRASRFHEANGGTNGNWPQPVKITGVSTVAGNDRQLQLPAGVRNFVNDDYTIVDDQTGQIYRVVRRLPVPNDDRIQLDRRWDGGNADIWVVPPAVGGGRNACIAVYQKEILF